MAVKISSYEAAFIKEGIQQNIRADGRARLDYRAFSVETGIVPQANGSARVRLSNTDVLIGVKVEIGEPEPDFPDEGRLLVYVECSPSASPEFEGRGAESLNAVLAAALDSVIHNRNAVDWKSLCITPGRQCWNVYVDALVLDSSGNLFDALSIAAKAALANTRIPKISVIEAEDGTTEIEVSDDPSEYTRIDTHNIPITVTMAKIGNKYVVDPTIEEELCMSARLTVGINEKGNTCSIQKGSALASSTTAVDSNDDAGLAPSEFYEMLQSARKIGVGILKHLDDILQKQEKTSHLPRELFS